MKHIEETYEELKLKCEKAEEMLASFRSGKAFADAALAASEKQYRMLAECTEAVLWEFTIPLNRWTYVAPQAERILGYAPEEWIDLDFWKNRLYEEDRTWASAYCAECTSRGKDHVFEYRFVKKDGSIAWIHDVVNIEMKEGEPYRMRGFMVDITSRKTAEERIRLSEERHRTTLNSIGDAVIAADEKGRITKMNPVAERLTGWTLKEANGRPMPEVFHIVNSLTREICENPVEKVFKTGGIVGLANHTVLISRDGTEYQIADSAAPIYNDESEITGVVLVFKDVTEEYRASDELKKREEELRQAQAVAQIGSWCFNLNTGTVTSSDEASRIYGLSGHEWTIKNIEMIPLPQYRESLDKAMDGLVNHGKPYDIEFKIQRASDGAQRIIHSLAEYDSESNKVTGTIHDITERKMSEEEIGRLKSAIEQADEIIVITDTEGTIQYVNPSFEIKTGYSRDEVLGQNPRILKSGEQDDKFYKEMWETLLSGKKWKGNFINKRKDNTFYTEEASISPVRDKGGKIVSFVAVKRDITSELETQNRLTQMEKMDSIGQLAGGVAHDFNNQLAGIMGYCDMLLQRLEDPELIEYVNNILTGAHRSADLTRQLLAFSRKGHYQNVSIDIHKIIIEAADILQHSIDKKITIIQRHDAYDHTIMGDPTQIQNALLNLAINARDAMPKGGELVFETYNQVLSLADCRRIPYEIAPGRFVVIRVGDTGFGMTEDIINHIFEPFFTTKETGKGIGMGLPAVYGTVKHHNGGIEVRSEPGNGTDFIMYFPSASVDSAEKADRKINKGELLGIRVLIIDDEEVIRKIGKEMLKVLGCETYTAANGEEGAAWYHDNQHKIDIVILDMIMPRMSGSETWHALREINPSVKILLSSGYSSGNETEQLLSGGGTGFIQKPFQISELAGAIVAVLKA